MPTVYRPQIDLLKINANGFRVPLAAETVSVDNITTPGSLGTLVSDANGVIVEGSFTAAVGDVVEFSHATYPLTFRLTLAASQELAYTGEINAYVVENLYSSGASKQVDIYARDSTNTALPPKKIGTGLRNSTVQIPYQSTVTQVLDIVPVALDEQLNSERTNFDTANFQPVTVLGAGSAAAEPYLISAYSADLTAALAAMTTGGRLKIDVDTTYAGASFTTPADVIFTFPNDSTLDVTDVTKTVTIGGKMEDPGTRQIFPGVGKVVLGGANVAPLIRPEWWAGNGSADDNHALDQIATSLTNAGGGVVKLGLGDWGWEDIPAISNVTWQGSGNGTTPANSPTVITLSDQVTAGKHVFKLDTDDARNIRIKDLLVATGAAPAASGIIIDQTVGHTFSGLKVENVTVHSDYAGGGLKQIYAKGTGHSEIVDVVFDQVLSITPAGSRSYQCDTINSDITWIQPRFVHNANAIGIYAQALGQAKMIRGNFSGINSANNDNRGATGSHAFNGTTTSGTTDITVVSGTLTPSDIGQPIYRLGVVDSYITDLTDDGGVTHITTLNVTIGSCTNQSFTIYRMLPDTARALTPIFIAGSHGVLDFEYTEEGYQRSFMTDVSVNDLLSPVNLHNCYIQDTLKLQSAIALNLEGCHLPSNAIEDIAGVTARLQTKDNTVDKTNAWGWELAKPQIWGDHPGGSFIHTEFNSQELEYTQRISPHVVVYRFDPNNAADVNNPVIRAASNALTTGSWPTNKRNHDPLLELGRLNPYSGEPDHGYFFARSGDTGHLLLIQRLETETAGIGGFDIDVPFTSQGAITAGGVLTGTGLTIASFTPGAIIFPTTGGVFAQDSSYLFYDVATHRFLLGGGAGATPARILEINDPTWHIRLGDRVTSGVQTTSYDIGRDNATGLLNFYGNQTTFVGYVLTGIDGELARFTSAGPKFTNTVAKTTPVDADSFLLIDSAASDIVKKVTGTNLKAYLGGSVSDTAYDATTWDAVTTIAPSKNAVRDKIEAMISDTAYNATSWDTVTTIAPSKNAVRDKFEALALTLPRQLFDIYADDTTAGTPPETLATYTVAANTLANNGDKITGFYAGISASNADEKQWTLAFAGTNIGDVLLEVNLADWRIDFSIIRVSSTTVRCVVTFSAGSHTVYPLVAYTSIASLNLASTGYNLVLTGSTPVLAGDITLKMGNGKFEPAA